MRRLPWWVNPWRERWRLLARVVVLGTEVDRVSRELDAERERNAELARQVSVMLAQQDEAGAITDLAPPDASPIRGLPGTKPEFVLVGVDRGASGGKRLYASRDISQPPPTFGAVSDTDPTMRLTAVMARMLIIDKPSYGEAMEHMATIWRNWDRDQAGSTAQIDGAGVPVTADERIPPGKIAITSADEG